MTEPWGTPEGRDLIDDDTSPRLTCWKTARPHPETFG